MNKNLKKLIIIFFKKNKKIDCFYNLNNFKIKIIKKVNIMLFLLKICII